MVGIVSIMPVLGPRLEIDFHTNVPPDFRYFKVFSHNFKLNQLQHFGLSLGAIFLVWLPPSQLLFLDFLYILHGRNDFEVLSQLGCRVKYLLQPPLAFSLDFWSFEAFYHQFQSNQLVLDISGSNWVYFLFFDRVTLFGIASVLQCVTIFDILKFSAKIV